MLLLLLFAFAAGLVTILAPCIWPLLPIILSSAVAHKGHNRPLGITLGVMLSFGVLTLTLSSLVRLLHFDPNSLRLVAVLVIGVLGLTMIVPYFIQKFEIMVTRLSNLFGQQQQSQGSGFTGGFVTGLSLGIVWAPCAGPILAAIAALAATGRVNVQVVLVTVAYVIGVGIPLFLFAYGGQRILTGSKSLSKYTGRIQQVFGVVMILTAVMIATNYDLTLETKLLNAFPALGQGLNGFESSSAISGALGQLKGQESQAQPNSSQLQDFGPAPDFSGVTQWLNPSQPLSIKQLRGKVVLVDFWTYTCINCIRTLPHVTDWYNKYKDDGFVVVGVHTPEFAFEHDTNNVLAAIKQFGIHYPVAQDNNYATWNAFNNQYWPAEYLIDANGHIREEKFGEGEYDVTEQHIQELLKEAGRPVSMPISTISDTTPQEQTSPETYVGAERMEFLYPQGSVNTGQQTFTFPSDLPPDHFAFSGQWNIADQYATAGNNAAIRYNFSAKHVYLVMHPGSTPGTVNVLIDGKPIDPSVAGADVKNGVITVDSDRLYTIVNLQGAENHTLELDFQTPGTQAYAFTFG